MAPHRSAKPFVYFLRRADGEGPVKIGCSQAPEERLSFFMAWAPYPLEIVTKIPGDETLERRFHAAFAHLHSHREWFRPAPELAMTLEQVQGGSFDISTLPAPQYVTRSAVDRTMSENGRRGVSWAHRLRHLKNRGVEIPGEVSKAAYRWSAGRFYHDYNPHNPADAAVVEAFLEKHPKRAR